MRMRFLAVLMICCSCGAADRGVDASWTDAVRTSLPLLGHRNWIVVADSAYPESPATGVETVYADADQLYVLKYVLNLITRSPHVRPIVWVDKEQAFVPESDAQGIEEFRRNFHAALGNLPVNSGTPHLDIIRQLDITSRDFKVLVIKTRGALPYTSIFLQLDCAYWSPEAEKRLRESMH